jgi:hypothetical protein
LEKIRYVILSSCPSFASPQHSLFGADLKKMPNSTRIHPGILSKQNYRFGDMASMFITNMRERANMAGNELSINCSWRDEQKMLWRDEQKML